MSDVIAHMGAHPNRQCPLCHPEVSRKDDERLREELKPDIDWLIESLCPQSSPIVDFNKARLKALISQKIKDELQRIDKANVDNGIYFYFEDMKDSNNGYLTMRQYIPKRIATLKDISA